MNERERDDVLGGVEKNWKKQERLRKGRERGAKGERE